jgi:hypothetical protein
MITTLITGRTLASTLAAALAAGALAFVPGTALAEDGASHLSPRAAEQAYLGCIDGAPTTPDSHVRWVASCRERMSTR